MAGVKPWYKHGYTDPGMVIGPAGTLPDEDSYDRYAVYRQLKGCHEGLRFSDLLDRVGWSNRRAVATQLRFLEEEGVVSAEPPPAGSDRRIHRIYKIGPGWTYRRQHEAILRQVSSAISRRETFYPESQGHLMSSGVGQPLVNVNLVIPASAKEARSYRPTPNDWNVFRESVSRVKAAVREALKREPGQWDRLLRETITEIVSSQDRCFFLIAYPYASLRTGKWPAPSWKEDRDGTVVIRRDAFPKYHAIEPLPRWGRSKRPILRPLEATLAKQWPPASLPSGSAFPNFYQQLQFDHDEHGHYAAGCCDCFHKVLWEKPRRDHLPRIGKWAEPKLTLPERTWAERRELMERLRSIHAAEDHLGGEKCRCYTIVRDDRVVETWASRWAKRKKRIASDRGGTPSPQPHPSVIR